MVLGSSSNISSSDVTLIHPPQHIRERLFAVYCQNVDGGYKIIHRPTTEVLLSNIESARFETVMDAADHALAFAIYAAALMTLTESGRFDIVGDEYGSALSRYMSAVEHCLAKADYIGSRHVRCLQAFIIYLVSIYWVDVDAADTCLGSHSISGLWTQTLGTDGVGGSACKRSWTRFC